MQRARRAFGRIVGPEWLLAGGDRDGYMDAMRSATAANTAGRGRRAASLEELQAIVRVANEFRTPLWPVALKNLGYGGAAPLLAGSVAVDLAA
jgi:4-cresol dehydrogenase (hydroxylating)